MTIAPTECSTYLACTISRIPVPPTKTKTKKQLNMLGLTLLNNLKYIEPQLACLVMTKGFTATVFKFASGIAGQFS